jgi:hypothetical protein
MEAMLCVNRRISDVVYRQQLLAVHNEFTRPRLTRYPARAREGTVGRL